MRFLLCCAALALVLVAAGCGGDSDSSTGSNQASTPRPRPVQIIHYINKYPRPRNPGPHPNARVERLIIRDIRVGTGPEIHAGDTGQFEFISTDWVTGQPLEAAWHKKRTFETRIEKNVVIEGWAQGIPGMRVGGRRQITIPPALGFTGSVQPELIGITTFFDVILLQANPEQPRGLSEAGGGAGTGAVDG
jgi:peptidylprolyl isomerase